jgi:HAD superfamily hydrolase (TIGR01509 family)
MTIRALIFDFDGLILDTETPDYVTWRQVYQAHGVDLPLETWGQAIGQSAAETFDPVEHLESLLGHRVDREQVARRQRELSDVLVAGQPIMPGVENVIASARQTDLKLAVASSSDYAWVGGHLTRLGLGGSFDAICTREQVARSKPAPDLFLAALDALGVAADEAVVFEDSPNGVTAANRAGIFVIAIPNQTTARLGLHHADMILSSLAELPFERLLERVRASRDGNHGGA